MANEPGSPADVAPPRRPGSHRAASPTPDPIRRLLPPLAAVTAVVAVILVLLWLNSPAHTSGPGPALQRPAALPTSASVSPSHSPSPSPSAHATAPKPRRSAPVAEPPATQRPAVTKIALTVLNNSRRTGLAHRAAAQVARRGWPIALIGNFTGRIPVSTVYYVAGEEPQARLLAREFPAVQRVLPRFRGLPGHGLTLVVTREWPA